MSANFALIAVTLNYHAKIQESTLAPGGLCGDFVFAYN